MGEWRRTVSWSSDGLRWDEWCIVALALTAWAALGGAVLAGLAALLLR